MDIVNRAKACQVDLPWWSLLAIGIVSRACLDYRLLDTKNVDYRNASSGFICKDELDRFFESQWCDTLLGNTSFDGNFVKWASKYLV